MKEYLASIDIGSSVIRVLAARPQPDGQLEIIGVGTSVSQGVRNGVIVNIEAAAQSITSAVKEAELMCGLLIEEAAVNITGRHLHGENSRGVAAVTNKERIIREEDVLRVIEGAQNIRIPADQEIIHVLSREFRVDDQEGVRDPIGMTGIRLEAEVHIVTAQSTAIANLDKAASGAGIRITHRIMNSLAASEGVLSEGEKDLGTAVVDIGGGTTSVILYQEGGVAYSYVLPVGGIHVTQDLSIGLKLPFDRAEILKKSHGCADVNLVDPTEKTELPAVPGRPVRWILKRQIAEIAEPRIREIFELVDEVILKSGLKKSLTGGIVLTGGGGLMEGSLHIGEEVTGLAVNQGFPVNLTGFSERVTAPDFAVSVGMLQYMNRMSQPDTIPHASPVPPEKNGNEKNVLSKLKHWISENL